MTETATLGGGCFWCLEAVFERLQGVRSVTSGYAGGHVANPTYRQVCSKTTGHAEVVRVEYDPDTISFRDLLRVFFTTHDPTTLNRQGADVGPQYRSIILWESETQRETAEAVMAELTEEGTFGDPIVTELEPLDTFYEAEEEHQDFYRNNPDYGYCRVVIDPKVAKLRKEFADRVD
ncbi:MAG: peptide-methionine (S)-S-oxide reductase MsrA [Longimicrobiales bacterium]|nr:peptide-methionine (S)-S-oxide reductase MsrA [Longimicrobiales bacterium]